MAKSCETFDHTADVGLAARADTPGELFEALGEGLADYICPRTTVRPREKRTLTVEAEDVEALAVDFLAALLNVIQADRFMVTAVSVMECGGTVAQRHGAALAGADEGDSPRKRDSAGAAKAVSRPFGTLPPHSKVKVTAELTGEPFDASRHEIHTEVKAITYHLLKVSQEQDGTWIGRVILDL
ncbi:MAG: archease [Phycisphaerae bacterium]